MNIPTSSASAEYTDRRSRFLSIADPLEHPDDVRGNVASTRGRFPGCNHVVWAFVWGEKGERFGSNDDHEPKGSAGRPALEVLRGSGLTNILILVVRFFGGTKLGIGGLSRAYSEATRRVLANLDSEPLVIRIDFTTSIEYPFYDMFRKIADEFKTIITDTKFDAAVHVKGVVAKHDAADFRHKVRDLTNGATEITSTDS